MELFLLDQGHQKIVDGIKPSLWLYLVSITIITGIILIPIILLVGLGILLFFNGVTVIKMIIFLPMVLIAVVLLGMFIRWVYKRVLFEQNSTVVRGELTDCDSYSQRDGTIEEFYIIVSFTFHSPMTGQEICETQTHRSFEWQDKPLPSPGAPVAIRFFRDDAWELL